MNKSSARSHPYVISDVRQLRALGAPVRQDIVDAVGALGPTTVSRLAAALGVKPTALYTHIDRLVRVGLLLRLDTSESSGRPAAIYDVPGRPVDVQYDVRDARFRKALERCVTAMLSSARRGFGRATLMPGVSASGPMRELWASRWKGGLEPRDLARLNALLHEAIGLLRGAAATPSRRGASLYELTFVLSPVVTPQARRRR